MNAPPGMLAVTLPPLVLAACSLTGAERLRPLPEGIRIPVFEEIRTPFHHRWDEDHGYPFSGAAVLDLDGDGRWEVIVGGGGDQNDVVLEFDATTETLVERIDGFSIAKNTAATYGITAHDVDDDGRTDLLVARDDGVTLYRNDGQRFRAEPVPIELAPNAVPFHVAVGDPDGDGDTDLYVSTFVSTDAFRSATFNDPQHAQANHLLRNDGGTFVDVTDDVSRGKQNCFMAAFLDLDFDGHQDLLLANNTGEVQILRGDGSLGFEDVPTRSGFGFWMALGVSDVDHDGDPDLFFSNAGNSIPSLFTRGDATAEQRREDRWTLLRNDSEPGQIRVTPLSAEVGFDGLGFAWGGVFEDVNLDGEPDLLVAQNYLKWPFHRIWKLPGKVLLGRPGGRGDYYPVDVMRNEHFGQSPLTVDLDGDGRHDVLWLNQNGPLRAFLNRTGEAGTVIVLPDDTASLGARIEGVAAGRTSTRFAVGGTGLLTDPAPSFPFPAEPPLERVTVRYRDGTGRVIEAPGPGVHRLEPAAGPPRSRPASS